MKTVYSIALLSIELFSTIACNQQNNSKNKEFNNNDKNKEKMRTVHLTKEEFLSKVVNYEENPTEWKYLGDKPAIVDFYASWCGPCKMIAPILEELAAQYEGKIYIYKVDTEQERELAAVFNIRSIPTLLFVPMDGSPQIANGAMSKSQFEEAIKTVLLK
jgi:thioredoxin